MLGSKKELPEVSTDINLDGTIEQNEDLLTSTYQTLTELLVMLNDIRRVVIPGTRVFMLAEQYIREINTLRNRIGEQVRGAAL